MLGTQEASGPFLSCLHGHNSNLEHHNNTLSDSSICTQWDLGRRQAGRHAPRQIGWRTEVSDLSQSARLHERADRSCAKNLEFESVSKLTSLYTKLKTEKRLVLSLQYIVQPSSRCSRQNAVTKPNYACSAGFQAFYCCSRCTQKWSVCLSSTACLADAETQLP